LCASRFLVAAVLAAQAGAWAQAAARAAADGYNFFLATTAPEALVKFLRAERARWSRTVRDIGMVPE
jgi:hypothetical protein